MSIGTLLGPLQGLLSFFQNERHRKGVKAEDALLAIRTALTQTRIYVESGKKSKKREVELSELWSLAAIKTRTVSERLVQKLQDKSVHWSQHLDWTQAEFEAKKLDFNSLEQDFSDLLKRT